MGAAVWARALQNLQVIEGNIPKGIIFRPGYRSGRQVAHEHPEVRMHQLLSRGQAEQAEAPGDPGNDVTPEDRARNLETIQRRARERAEPAPEAPDGV